MLKPLRYKNRSFNGFNGFKSFTIFPHGNVMVLSIFCLQYCLPLLRMTTTQWENIKYMFKPNNNDAITTPMGVTLLPYPQPAFTCSRSTKETPEQGVNDVVLVS